MQAPRSLWDPTYVEKSWITKQSTHGPIRLLPRLQEKIDKHYPGTRLAITEYNYGGGADISGAIAQADVLGIFGREGVFAAALWHVRQDRPPLHRRRLRHVPQLRRPAAARSATSAWRPRPTTSERTSVYASLDEQERVVLVALNKSPPPLLVEMSLEAHAAEPTCRGLSIDQGPPAAGAGQRPAGGSCRPAPLRVARPKHFDAGA